MIDINKLKIGTKLFGKIVNIEFKENNIYIVKIDKEELTAYSELDFVQNEKVFLEVFSEGRIPKLKLQKANNVNKMSEFPETIRVLKTCNLEINELNLEIMNEYLIAGHPIQLDKIIQFFKEKINIIKLKNKNF